MLKQVLREYTGDVMLGNAHINDLVRGEYIRRRECNPQYSLRSFAQHLKLSSGALSEIMHGKRKIGPKLSVYLQERLGHLGSPVDAVSDSQLQTLTQDQLKILAEWYHYPIQDLLRTKSCKRTPSYIASRLNITAHEALAALQRMQRLEMVRQTKGLWYSTEKIVTTSVDVASTVIRNGHRQDMRNAEIALDTISIEERDFSSITMCFDTSRMDEAKQRIKEFRRAFWKEFDVSGGSEVYQLTMYMFPLTKPEKR
ncbi:MAG: DUF4423 domain-containing protein [Proteobacteria bacterium]|nr:DUF4423 domain-containing protein [Pseudomonadota bacterium]